MPSPTVKEPSDSDPGDSTKAGAPDFVHVAKLLKGTHATEKIQKEAIENTAVTLSDIQNISGAKKFADEKLTMDDSDASHKYIHKAGNLSADRKIVWPALAADDTPLFENQSATVTNKTINADQNTITNLADTNIKAGAAISLSKLAALTASRALVSDGSGVVAVSSVTSTELGHVSGVTSAIQTQLNAKISTTLNSAQIIVGNGSNVATAVAVSGDITISNAGVTTLAAAKNVLGLQDMWIPAGACYPRTSNGCAALAQRESATNKVNLKVLDFDDTTQEFAQCAPVFARNYNNGTIKATPYWTADAGTAAQGVVWGISGISLRDDDAIDTALGTAQTSTDAYIAAGDVHIGPQTAAITLAGTVADQGLVVLQVSRNPSDGSDTKTGDARFLGMVVEYTIDAATAA